MIDLRVAVKGAGEMGSAVAWCLRKSHLKVFMTDIQNPLAVRREVCFCEAVYDGVKTVEGTEATLIQSAGEAYSIWEAGGIPLLIDPGFSSRAILKPHVVVDAILAKQNTGTTVEDGDLVIGLGPGFTAGIDVHLVVETNRGHHLGRIITDGQAEPNTGIPGNIGGFTQERVFRAPVKGKFTTCRSIGEFVKQGETVGFVDGMMVVVEIDGVLRGLIRDETLVNKGAKLGDIDPRGERAYCYTISEKARAIGGSVLEAIMRTFNRG